MFFGCFAVCGRRGQYIQLHRVLTTGDRLLPPLCDAGQTGRADRLCFGAVIFPAAAALPLVKKRRIYYFMAEKLKIIPLGGLNEIGKNMTAYEYGGEIIVVDCGMAFPGDDMYGIDCVIPDVTYLVKNRSRLRGLFITHGHEDHIGAIPYVLKQINLPIYCTKFTAGLIKLKLQEHGLVGSTKLITVEPGQTVRAGKFQVEFIHVNT